MAVTAHSATYRGEGMRFEAKSAQKGLPRSLWETYSAFANTDGGTIVLGVEEGRDGTLRAVGVPEPERLVKELWDALNNPSCVSANILVDTDVVIETSGDVQLIAIRVPRAPRPLRPVYIHGNMVSGTYRRNGEGDYHCPPDELRSLVRDGGEGTDRLVLEDMALDALCDETIGAYRNAFGLVRPAHPWNGLPTTDFLARLGACARSGRTHELHPTRAGLLMFGQAFEIAREYPGYFLDYRTKLGDRRWDDRVVSNDGTWSGNVYDFWRRVSPKVTEGLETPFSLGTGLRRSDDTPLHQALREALANTLVHADYYGKRYTVIVREPDRVTFANPGGLRMGADVAFQGGISDARNETLMTMFNLVGIGERAGSGFDGMRAGCDWARLPYPELSETFGPDRTTLVFHTGPAVDFPPARSANLKVVTTQPGRESAGRETPPRARRRVRPVEARTAILHFIEENGEIRRIDVQDILGVGSTKAKGILGALVSEGIVVSQGAGPATRYLRAAG